MNEQQLKDMLGAGVRIKSQFGGGGHHCKRERDLSMNKYHAKISISSNPEFAGRKFASEAERDRADFLLMLAKSKDGPSRLECQPLVQLTPDDPWKLDFYYILDGVEIWEDVKGQPTREFKRKLRLWKKYGPGLLKIVTRERNKVGWKSVDVKGGGMEVEK